MKKINRKKNKGILFWITGISGSGKTTVAKLIKPEISKLFGPVLLISGDKLRKIFNLKGYSEKKRLIIARQYCKFCKLVTDQNINLILSVIALKNELREWNRKNINNYIEIYIKIDKSFAKQNKKRIYNLKKNVVDVDIKPEFPKSPDILVKNQKKKNINDLSNIVLKKIKKILI